VDKGRRHCYIVTLKRLREITIRSPMLSLGFFWFRGKPGTNWFEPRIVIKRKKSNVASVGWDPGSPPRLPEPFLLREKRKGEDTHSPGCTL
jgi:hypothetical protein